MNIERSWWKGTLPSWTAVLLLSAMAFGGKRLLDEHDRLTAQVAILGNRVLALEFQIKLQSEQLAEAKTFQKQLTEQIERNRRRPL